MYPSLEEVKKYRDEGSYDFVAVKEELYSDTYTAISILKRLRDVSNHVFLLESAENIGRSGRWTFLGFDPVMEVTAMSGKVRIREKKDGKIVETFNKEDSPKKVLRAILNRNRRPRQPGFPPFSGGFAGYFSYDYVKYSEERLQEQLTHPGSDFLDMDMMLFRELIIFDHYRGRLIFLSLVDLSDPEKSYEEARRKIASMVNVVRNGFSYHFRRLVLKSEFTTLHDKEDYYQMVEKTREYIREGDIFQAVISNPMKASAEGSLFETYRILRTSNPSPYMFYFNSDDIEIAGASPETLLRLEDGKLYTYPLAGTRKRGATAEEDKALEESLLSDEKELSEHNMLVDLGRNDIGKVAKVGSVKVSNFHEIVRYSHVMHIASTVTGELREDLDGLDAIESILPAGTLSGAPKIRAAEIINELERSPRGVYGGAIGYIDLSGNLDTCISIRLAYMKNGTVTVHTGSGIVADSDPAFEAEECLNKGQAVLSALKAATEGIDDFID